MKRLLCALILLLGAGPLLAQGTIADFYRTADSISTYPAPIANYEIKCQRKLLKRYVTFIGRKGEKKIFIAAITLKPIRNLSKELSLTVRFNGPKPDLGPTSTWGYIYDRNGDGKIDYVSLVGTAAAVEGENFPDDFPGFGSAMSPRQFEQYIESCRIVFNHWADDNFDGTLDAAVVFDMDPFRNWVRRYLLVHSTKFTGRFDDVRAFRTDIAKASASVEFSPTEIPYYPLGSNKAALTPKMFDEPTAILSLLNRAAGLCKVGADLF